MSKLLFILCALLALAALGACNLPAATPTPLPQTWIDAPLDGSSLPLAPYEVVLHATDRAGIQQVELSVNGALLATLPNPAPAEKLPTLRFLWTPPAPGVYTLSARALNVKGEYGAPAQAVVTVGEVTPIPDVDTPTPTPTLTLTPSQTPTLTSTPTPAEITFSASLSVDHIYYGRCNPQDVQIVAIPSDMARVANLTLFVRLQNVANGEVTDWTSGLGMSRAPGGFTYILTSTNIPGYLSHPDAWVQYQFVATDAQAQIIGRSPVYSDLALSLCGSGFIFPTRIFIPLLPTPTPTKLPIIP